MELPKRKYIRLKGFNYSSCGTYFITICTKDKQKILSDIVGDGVLDVPKVKLTEIGKIVDKYINSINNTYEHIEIDEYCIMPNHIHLLIFVRDYIYGMLGTPSPTNNTISMLVSTLKRFVNKEIGYNIWQRSYFDHIIRNRDSYREKRNYIYNNPANWKYDEYK